MALAKFTKQISETFPISVDFSDNMATGEVILSEVISATDNAGDDVTADVLSDPGNDGAQAVTVRVLAGTEALSPYKITFVATTDESNVWELDVLMKIKEL